MARRGRPRGALSWARNPVNFAAHHAKVLLELWLAGVPIQIGPQYNLLPSLMTSDRPGSLRSVIFSRPRCPSQEYCADQERLVAPIEIYHRFGPHPSSTPR